MELLLVTGALLLFVVLVAINPVALDALLGTHDHPPSANEIGQFEFEEVAFERGLVYQSGSHDQEVTWAGVYVADINNNGFEDVLAIGGDRPTLFVNTDGELVEDRSFDHRDARSAHFLDYNNNGYEDLLILIRGKPPAFYANTGGTFERQDVGFDRPLVMPYGAVSADFTGNGLLDIFIFQNGEWTTTLPLTPAESRAVYENHPAARPSTTTGEPNRFYVNSDGTFMDASDAAGFTEEDWTLAASAVDFTRNGHPDIHVANDFSRDYLYVNHGAGRFEQRELGQHSDRNAMSSTVADFSGNLHPDLFVTNIWFDEATMDAGPDHIYRIAPIADGNTLFINDGSGTFTDQADVYGVQAGGWGWAAVVADLTNSGRQDLVHTTSVNRPWEGYENFTHPQAWVRTEDGFEPVSGSTTGFISEGTRGISTIDLDGDGTLDLVVATTGGAFQPGAQPYFRVYENQLENNDAVQFFVRNPHGIDRNTEIYVEKANGEVEYHVANGRTDLLSQQSRLIHVGTGDAPIDRVRVVWPNGAEGTYTGLTSGTRYVITPDEVEPVTTFRED